MKGTGLVSRLSYLVTRMIVRPERALHVVEQYAPIFDIVILTIIGLIWFLLVNVLGMARFWIQTNVGDDVMADYLSRAVIGYSGAQIFLLLYAFCVSTAMYLLRGKVHYLQTMLAYWLSGIVGLAASIIPAAIIKLVDYGDDELTISRTIVTVMPWVYIAYLVYISTGRIFRNEGPQVIVYLVLGGLPLLLFLVVLRGMIPPAYYLGVGWH